MNELMDMQQQLELLNTQLAEKDLQLFQKENQLKLADAQIEQLKNSNEYRKEDMKT